jgi:hypothetical protein
MNTASSTAKVRSVTPEKQRTKRSRAGAAVANLTQLNDDPANTEPTSDVSPPQPLSKRDQMILLMRRPEGATVAELVGQTGWQVHSIRGAIAGSIKKKLGASVDRQKIDGRGLVYRIAGGAE